MQRFQLNPKVSASIVFVSAMFMSIMDGTIVNVALPSLSQQLSVSNTSIDAVVVSYLVSLSIMIPVSGWLGDRFGTKRIFLLALVLFSVASAMCGLAGNFTMLVLFRVFQGIAGGALIPVGTTILYRTFPPSERVQLSRILIMPTVLAPAAGPVLGGFLVDQLSWRWVFYVNVPIGIATCLFGLIFLQERRESTAGRFDLAGFLLASGGLAFVMYALSEGPTYGWSTPEIFGSALIGLLLLIVFVFVELRTREPMIDLRLFSNRLFRTANLISLFASAGFLGVLFVGPLFLQEGRGVSALDSGLTTFPEAIGVALSTQLVARLYPKIGPRRLLAGGLTGVAIMMAFLCFMGNDTSLWLMRVLMFLIGAGMAYVFLPLQAASFATISPTATGRASAIYNAQRQLGSALGIAIMSTVLGAIGLTSLNTAGNPVPNWTAYHAAFLAAAALALIGAGIALKVHDKDAAATMRRGEPASKKIAEVQTSDTNPVALSNSTKPISAKLASDATISRPSQTIKPDRNSKKQKSKPSTSILRNTTTAKPNSSKTKSKAKKRSKARTTINATAERQRNPKIRKKRHMPPTATTTRKREEVTRLHSYKSNQPDLYRSKLIAS